jgi:hypothetical protein
MKDGKRRPAARGSRREFTKAAAALLVAGPAALTDARAQTPTPTPAPEPKAPPNPQPTPAAPQQPPPPSPVALAYAEVARARFGGQVSEEELTRIRRDLEGNVRAAERLRAHKLANADEPDFVFSA